MSDRTVSRLAKLARAHIFLMDALEQLEAEPLDGGQREHARVIISSVYEILGQYEEQLVAENVVPLRAAA